MWSSSELRGTLCSKMSLLLLVHLMLATDKDVVERYVCIKRTAGRTKCHISQRFHNCIIDVDPDLSDKRGKRLLSKRIVRNKAMKIKHMLCKIENVKLREKKQGNRTRTIREVVRKECKGCRVKKKRVATLYECRGCDGYPGYCTECFCEAHL